MNSKLLTAVIAAAFVSVSAASWAQVAAGGNVAPKYSNVEASKNRKVVNHGVGGNSAPMYAKVDASKNKTVSKHGVGGNAEPIYPKVGIH
jgi:serine protease inhibitor ecotin